MKNRSILLSLILFLTGCLGFETEQHLTGNFYLTAVDAERQMNLSYQELSDNQQMFATIVEATVFAVGFDGDHIILKQHPGNLPQPFYRTTTNYFIVTVSTHFNFTTKKDLIGPLTYDQFNQKRKELHIPESLKFTIVKKDLE